MEDIRETIEFLQRELKKKKTNPKKSGGL